MNIPVSKITSHHIFSNMIYNCINFEAFPDKTLKEVINEEISSIKIMDIDKWLRSLPEACIVPYEDNIIRQILDNAGNRHWSIDDYWRWCASRIQMYANSPKSFA